MPIPFGTSFTWKRPRQSVVDATGNTVLSANVTMNANLIVTLRDLRGTLSAEDAGLELEGMYNASCLVKDGVPQVADMLYDNNNNQANGQPIQYEVAQSTVYPIVVKLHLHRSDIS